jgi:Na+/proline symporter
MQQPTLERTRATTRRTARRAEQVGERVEHSKWVERLGRFGYVALGITYGIVALLALEVAFGAGGKTTNHEGALKTIADEPVGFVLVAVLALGFAGYAIWRFVQAVLDRDDEGSDPKGLAKRASYLGRGAFYAGLCILTVELLAGSGGGGSGREEELTARILAMPLGRWIVGIAGIAIFAAGLVQGHRALTQKFREDLEVEKMLPATERWVTRLGILGYLARMVVFCLIGIFVTKAAYEFDPGEARGLDGTLSELAQQSYGSWLLGLTAAGLLAFGAFCLAAARYRRI